MIPGEFFIMNKEIICNAGREIIKITVANTDDRPIQVGSHFHFFEVNRALEFDRERAFGMRLNIASGTGVRFEAHETKEVELVALSGAKTVYGLNGLTGGPTTKPEVKTAAVKKAGLLDFKGV